jgi:hypothetical protein
LRPASSAVAVEEDSSGYQDDSGESGSQGSETSKNPRGQITQPNIQFVETELGVMFGLLDFGDVLQMRQVGLLEVQAAEVL